MAQDGRKRGGTVHGEIGIFRESQGWSTACSSMPERGGKDQGNDSPKQVGSFWFTDVVSSFCGSAFVLFCFLFVFVILLKPRPFVQSFFFLRYACVSTATRVLSVSSFFLRCRFFRIFSIITFSLRMESTSHVFSTL